MTVQPITDFDVAFNARGLTPEQVAAHFVPPVQFKRLADPENALVVGPRGTGKTTVLKMLLPAALENWNHEDADEIKRRVTYTSFFVATDRTWVDQIEAAADRNVFSIPERDLIILAAFKLQVLSSLVRAMQFDSGDPSVVAGSRSEHSPLLTRPAEAELVAELAEAWSVEPRIPSLAGLHRALGRANVDMYTEISAERFRAPESRSQRLADNALLHLDYRQAALLAIRLYNELVGRPDARWAMLCDELELAPPVLRDSLLSALRGTDPLLINKLSLAPYTPGDNQLGKVLGARADHDYVPISLAYGRESSSYAFCDQLVSSVLARRGWAPQSARQILGSSGYDVDPDEDGLESGYGKDSGWVRRFRSLQKKDESFAEYLDRAEIDLDHLKDLPEEVRAATVRKVAPIVAVRDEFRGTGTARAGRARKKASVPSIYTGDRAFFAMLEGNPRNLIGVVSRLLDGAPIDGRVSKKAQARELAAIRNRFRAFVATIPLGAGAKPEQSRGLLVLLDAIGGSLRRLTVEGPFDDDPPGTFTVDETVPESMLHSLGEALNAGAIIYLPAAGADPNLRSLRSGRFRLAYLFAPDYHLPIRRGRGVSLARLLTGPTRVRQQARRAPASQPGLFTEESLDRVGP